MSSTAYLALAALAGLGLSACYNVYTSKTSSNPESSGKQQQEIVVMAGPGDRQQRPTSNWLAKCHPLEAAVSKSVHEYFLEGWVFRSDKARAKFPRQGLATWHCYAFPEAKDDRIEAGALLSVILFLVDGISPLLPPPFPQFPPYPAYLYSSIPQGLTNTPTQTTSSTCL